MNQANKGVLIWGAGAVGGSAGAIMARAGCPVVLVDTWPEHIAAIRANGLQLVGSISAFTTQLPIFPPHELTGTWRIVVMAVKAQHTDAACAALAPHLASDGGVLSLQNGMAYEVIARHFGRNRTYATASGVAGDVLEPGIIRFAGHHGGAIERVDGQAGPGLDEMIAAMRYFDPESHAGSGIEGDVWSKQCHNALNSAMAMAMSSKAELLARQDLRPFWIALLREVVVVARAHGVTPNKIGMPRTHELFDPIDFAPETPVRRAEASLQGMLDRTSNEKPNSGMWRDLNVRKRQTEVAALLTPIVELAERYGIQVPLLRGTIAEVGAIEAGRKKADDRNLVDLLARSNVTI